MSIRVWTFVAMGLILAGHHSPMAGAETPPAGSPGGAAPGATDEAELPDPPFWQSADGELKQTLTIQRAPAPFPYISTASTNLYNGLYIPPVWCVRRGDVVKIHFVNHWVAPTTQAASIASVMPLLQRRLMRAESSRMARPSRAAISSAGQSAPAPAAPAPATVPPAPAPPATMPSMDMPAMHMPGSYSNLHFHGLRIPATQPGDDVSHIRVAPGASFDYQFTVPLNHPQGLYWYHPHPHGVSELQVLGGLSGVIIIDGLLEDDYPQLSNVRQRVMLLKDFQRPDPLQSDNPTAPLMTINGREMSRLTMAPGEVQLWRMANVGANAFFDMQLQDERGQPVLMYLIAVDGNPTRDVVPCKDLFLPPAGRMEALVAAPRAGNYALKSLAVLTSVDSLDPHPGPGAGDPNPEVTLAHVHCTGAENPRPVNLQELKPKTTDGRPSLADWKRGNTQYPAREFRFSEDKEGKTFKINEQTYDMHRVDTTVDFPSVEEWTVKNLTRELHVFHIHQLSFIVEEINGRPQPFHGYQDSITVPYEQDGKPGEVKLLMPFTDPNALGDFVYHCHILGHEDGGMMANISVRVRPADRAK